MKDVTKVAYVNVASTTCKLTDAVQCKSHITSALKMHSKLCQIYTIQFKDIIMYLLPHAKYATQLKDATHDTPDLQVNCATQSMYPNRIGLI